MDDKLCCGQAQNGVNLDDFQAKFDIEVQSRSLQKIKRIVSLVFYTFELNLMIIAWTGHKLSRG